MKRRLLIATALLAIASIGIIFNKGNKESTVQPPASTEPNTPSAIPTPTSIALPQINENTNLEDAVDKLTPEDFTKDFNELDSL